MRNHGHVALNARRRAHLNHPGVIHYGWQFVLRKIPSTQQRSCPGKLQYSLLMLGI